MRVARRSELQIFSESFELGNQSALSNGSSEFKMTYLRAPAELDNIIADLGFSAKVLFFLYFF